MTGSSLCGIVLACCLSCSEPKAGDRLPLLRGILSQPVGCHAVNPKRILKSKARAAAEADREAKRSKALTSSQALAEAKAAALASGWDTDDDFETLPRR